MKEASKLAPRNIERNKKLWDLARLNHDKAGQLSAVQKMAKFAKNSIHDSPQLSFNVIRATIDLATSLGDIEADKHLAKAEIELEELKKQKGVQAQMDVPIDVLNTRLLCLKGNKKEAEKVINSLPSMPDNLSMEDNLDMMKAYHELGMKEQCVLTFLHAILHFVKLLTYLE